MKKFKHIISLGYFCSVALELERIGLRDSSSPFDWVIIGLEDSLKLIKNNFSEFLCLDFMQQHPVNRSLYVNTKYSTHFYHDFDKYKKCEDQIRDIENKYRRRIERFYKNIQEPTLFVRYISNQNECIYIESNMEQILADLHKYNIDNDIIFIANNGVISSKLKIFEVEPDKGDVVSRKFLEKNNELRDYLCSDLYDKQKRDANYKLYKSKKTRSVLNKYPGKCIRLIKSVVLSVKIHCNTYSDFKLQ